VVYQDPPSTIPDADRGRAHVLEVHLLCTAKLAMTMRLEGGEVVLYT
jgi:hypothetical protein